MRNACSTRATWSVEESALFAARKEFELLKLLSTDKKALATARRLGLFVNRTESHSHKSTAAVDGAGAATSSKPAAAAAPAPSGCHPRPPRRPVKRARPGERDEQSQPQPLQSADAVGGAAAAVESSRARSADGASARASNARQRRSAARSARRHLQRQRYIRSRMLAVLFALRLRRRARLRRALQDVGELSDASSDGQSVPAKRGTADRPPSSSSGDDSELLAITPASSGYQPCSECSTELPEGSRLDIMATLGCFSEGPIWVCRPCACKSYPDLVEFFPRKACGERRKAPAKRGGGWRLGKR